MIIAVVLAWSAWTAPAAAQRAEVYRPPLSAEVIDPFRPPDQPWLAGNRGLEYGTTAGTAVAAIGSGLVVFAGPVAGQLYVTVLHGDGIRSSYSYLSSLAVSVGDRVFGGQVVGVTSDVPFHLGARVGDTYIDPASLFGTEVGVAAVFLVPTGAAPPVPSGGTRTSARSGGSVPVEVEPNRPSPLVGETTAGVTGVALGTAGRSLAATIERAAASA